MKTTPSAKLAAVTAFTAITSIGVTVAGDAKTIVAPPTPESKSVCDTLKTIGTFYKNADNPYIQEFKLFGRYHYQAGSIAGSDVNGDHFNSKFDIHRRARLGGSVKFAQFFKVKFESQLVADARYKGGELNWGQPDSWLAYDQAWLSFDLQKAFDLEALDKLSVTYGRQKFLMGAEVHASSKHIKTIERSALANTVYLGALPAGFTISGTKGSWKVNASVYSDVTATNKWDSIVGDWSGGEGYLLNVIKTFENDDQLIVDYFYHNDTNGPAQKPTIDGGDDWFFNKKWAASVAYQGERGPWGFMVNVIGGEHGEQTKSIREGLFYGVITQGTYWLIEDHLELVGQYQWQGSDEEEGIRAYSKDFGSGTSGAPSGGHGGDVNSGRGDSHHLVYTGLNWYLCGDNAKIMTGVEYDNLDTPDGNADAFTLWAAYRMYF
jgi:hypothetical protein